MKKMTVLLIYAAFILHSALLIAQASESYTEPQTLKSYLPSLKGYRVGGKDLVSYAFIEKRKFPIAMRTFYKDNTKIVVKITDAHYESVAYRDYYFYVDLKEKEPAKTDKFGLIKVGGENVYTHHRVQQRLVKGIVLVGNRYIVEVIVNPASDAALVGSVMELIDFDRLAEVNNPVRYRKMDFRFRPAKTEHENSEY